MAKVPLPPAELMRQLFDYDPETGEFLYKERDEQSFSPARPAAATFERDEAWALSAWNAQWAGRRAGSVGKIGYRILSVGLKRMPAHRVAWAIFYGEWPKLQIDHIDGDRGNNRIANLRQVSPAENQKNMRRYATNTSGVSGVYLHKASGLWHGVLSINRRPVSIGYFKTIDQAAVAMRIARAKYGFAPGHGLDRKGFDGFRSKTATRT